VAVRLTLLSWLSLALGAVIILLMIISDGDRVGVTFIYLPRAASTDTELLGLHATDGRFELLSRTSPLNFDRALGPVASHELIPPRPITLVHGYEGFGQFALAPFSISQANLRFSFPLWPLLPWCLILPARDAYVARRAQRRRARRLCPACGYDLRATAGPCPECGCGPRRLPTCARRSFVPRAAAMLGVLILLLALPAMHYRSARAELVRRLRADEALLDAIEADDPAGIDRAVAAGADPRRSLFPAYYPITLVAHRRALDHLLDTVLDVNASIDRSGATPLHFVVARGDEAHARHLLERGADPNAKTFVEGFTPRDFARTNGWGWFPTQPTTRPASARSPR
jgi:hypothetical protein